MDVRHETRLEDRVAAIVGIATGVFGVLATCGLVLLPSTTLAQKATVIGASLTLSVACAAAIGAWRSARRFGVASGAALLTVVLLGALAMVTDAQRVAAADAKSPGVVTARGGSPGPSYNPARASASSDNASSTGVVYLSDLQSVNNQGFEPKAASIAGTTYEHSLVKNLGCYYNGQGSAIEYNIGRKYARLRADLGPSEDSPAGLSVPFRLYADGTLMYSADVKLGDVQHLDKVVTGVYHLTLELPDMGCIDNRGAAVWGDARLDPAA